MDWSRKYSGWILTVVLFLIFALFYWWFLGTPYFQGFLIWSQRYWILLIVILILMKIVSIVYAPLSGGVVMLGMIPVLGWPLAYFVDYVGSMLGGSAAFFLGKKYGQKFVGKLFGPSLADKVGKIKINHSREFEVIFLMRLLGSSLSDFICYGAGIVNVKYKNFISASILSHPIIGIPTFYLSSQALTGKMTWMSGILLILALAILYKARGRYLD